MKAAEARRPEGHAELLARLIGFALYHVPSRGIFDPGEIDDTPFYQEISDAARAHLGLNEALAELKAALDKAHLSFNRRDPIETALSDVRGVSDTASYYAGLAFGLVFASMSGAVSR